MLMTGSEALVEVLRQEGVDVVFGLVGSAFMDPLDLFSAAGIRFISVRHEQNAALMADGYARATGRPGVCIGQNGPGVTNLVTGVASAFLNHSPMIVITPAVTSSGFGTRAIQEIDQMALMQGITVHQVRVSRPDRIGWSVRNAFRAAMSARGPAQVDIPRDYFYGEFDDPGTPPGHYRSTGGFGGAPEDSVQRAADLLTSAKAPVILAGTGVVESGAGPLVAKLAESLGAPMAAVYLHNDACDARHPLTVGPIGYQGSKAAMRLLAEADVVLALGTRLNAFGTIPQYDLDYFPREAKLIHNDISPLELGALRPFEVALVGDARAVTAQLLSAIGTAPSPTDLEARGERITRAKEEWARELRELSSSDAQPMAPRRALWETARAVPDDAIVVTDVGNITGTANAYFAFDHPRRWLAAGSLGGIGVGYSCALGAKVARPDLPVVALVGDGAWSMTMQETITAVNENIPVVAVVFNNAQYGAEKRNQYDFFDERFFFTDLRNPDFAAIADDMGAVGISVTDPGELGPAISKAVALECPVVIDVHVDPRQLSEPYRRDAFQPPKRLLSRYQA